MQSDAEFIREFFDLDLALIEARAEARGETKGEARGCGQVLIHMLRKQFGTLPAHAEARVKEVSKEQCLELVDTLAATKDLQKLSRHPFFQATLTTTPSSPGMLPPIPTKLLEATPCVHLAQLPTPLEPAPRLGAELGLPALYVKRDDCTGLALGGNKARKLEYLFAEALALGADTVLTTGGVQSNHARMTAAAACRLGMRAILCLADAAPEEEQGNLLLDRLFGAEVRFLPDLSLPEMEARMEALAAELRAQGRVPYIIPVGGSTSLGCLGYVRAVTELAAQAAERKLFIDGMVVAAGSTGTLAGILLGARLALPQTRVYGISVSPRAASGKRKCARIAAEAAERLGVDWRPEPEEVPIDDRWLGPAYGVPTPEGLEAIRLAARTEGLLLDPVYTGKALAGLRGLAAEGTLRADETIVFWHTGGAPALFAHPEQFAEE